MQRRLHQHTDSLCTHGIATSLNLHVCASRIDMGQTTRLSSASEAVMDPTMSAPPMRSSAAGWIPPLAGNVSRVPLPDLGTRSAQEMPGGTPCPSSVFACKSMKRSLSAPNSSANATSSMVVVADPVPSSLATTGVRGIVTGAVLPARSSAQVPPPWMWLMCSTPASGKPLMFSSTFTPPSTSVSVAVPLTPESRLGVSWRFALCAPCAKALPPRTKDATKVAPKTTPANRFGRYMITLLLRYSLTLRVTIGFRRRTGLRQWANSLHTFDRFVFPTQDLVGSLQTSGGLVNVAVVLVESGLGGSSGIGGQAVS